MVGAIARAEPDFDLAIQELFRQGRPRRVTPLRPRERVCELVIGGAFIVVATAMAFGLDADRAWELGPELLLVLGFAVATRLKLDVGAGFTVPIQLLFVPMLLLLPTPAVPALVAAGWWLGALPDVIALRVHPERVLLGFGNSWFAVGPALVLTLADAQTPDWSDWPIYLAALAAQLLFDLVASALREWIADGVAPSLHVRYLGWVHLIDVLLSPIGLLAAFASANARYAVLLLFPAGGIFALFARERTNRLADAIELTERSREAAELNARLLVSERESARAREEMLAGASHEILTPIADLTTLVHRLRSDSAADPARRREYEAAMLRELALLRHLVGQFLDYTRLKAGRDLEVSARPTDLAPLVREVAGAFDPTDAVELDLPSELPPAMADPGRVSQMLLSLVDNAVKYSPPRSPVVIGGRALDGKVELSVTDHGHGIPEDERARIFDELRRGTTAQGTAGAGLGLYLCRLLAEAQDGEIGLETAPGVGSRFTIVLPTAQGGG